MDVDALRDELQKLYRALTASDVARHPTKRVPDFREHHGVQLRVHKRFLSSSETERPVERLAMQLAHEAAGFERGVLRGADESTARVFLERHDLPTVFLLAGNRVKFRHVFGAAKVEEVVAV